LFKQEIPHMVPCVPQPIMQLKIEPKIEDV
jgi:hypothetical protein